MNNDFMEHMRQRSGVLLLVLLLLLGGCGAKQADMGAADGAAIIPAEKPVSQYVKKDIIYPIDAYDPFERINRSMYIFNYYFDKYVFLPLVQGYEWLLPDYVEDRISCIFNNFSELRNLINNLLQLKPKAAAITTARFVINSTIGLAGMYDPAAFYWDMKERDEDFGQTLGRWGVGPGPYLVLPVFGPSSLRDTGGLAVDGVVRSLVINWSLDELDTHDQQAVKAGIDLLQAVDQRHRYSFRYFESGSPFEYEFVRRIYLEKRKLDVMK